MKKVITIARGFDGIGVKNYIFNILTNLESKSNNNETKDFSHLVLTDSLELKKLIGDQAIYHESSNKILWDFFISIFYLVRHNPDEVIYTKNVIPFTHLFFNWKKKLVIYDLGYFDKKISMYKFFDTLYMKMCMSYSAFFANKIITISNFTKNEILSKFKVNENKIVVAYPSINKHLLQNNPEKNSLTLLKKMKINLPFVFYVGSISPRKNVLRMLQAFNKIQNFVPHEFIIVTSHSWNNQDVTNFLSTNPDLRVKIINNLSDSELNTIYEYADCLIFTSLYEGFGLPIIEAQYKECPVITSNIGACAETAGYNYSLTVNPYDTDEIAEKLLLVLTKKINLSEIIQVGKNNTKRFSLEKAIKGIYNES